MAEQVGSTPLRLMIADDHGIVRQALRLLLEREGFDVVGEAMDGSEAVRVAAELLPDVAVLDRLMPIACGLEAAWEIRRVSPRTRVILLTGRQDEECVLQAVEAGARGCVVKSQDARDLIAAIREVARGGTYLSAGASAAVTDAFLGRSKCTTDPLTRRERQVLQLIAEGKRTREIAVLLGVSVKTAETHRSRLVTKLGSHHTADLVRYAIRRGLTEA
jgi:DNA-binding NarL/FixJ family response regulator